MGWGVRTVDSSWRGQLRHDEGVKTYRLIIAALVCAVVIPLASVIQLLLVK